MIFNIPQLNPLKPYIQTDFKGNEKIINTISFIKPSANKSYSRQGIDSDFYARNLNTWMDSVGYRKPYLSSDRLTMTWTGIDIIPISLLVPYVARIIDCKGNVYVEIPPTVNSLVATGERIYSIDYSLHLVPNGVYYVQIQQIGYAPNIDYFIITEPFEIRDEWADTVVFEYKNTTNAQGVFFDEIDMTFQTRVHGSIMDLSPSSTFNVFENQTRDLTLLSGTPFRTWSLNIGVSNKKVPEYILDQLERVMVCDTVFIDGIEYTREEGSKWEKTSQERYPLYEAKLPIRQKINDHDLNVVINPIKFMDLPETDVFFLKEINYSIGGGTTPLVYFTHKTRLLGYLNNIYLSSIDDSYFSINEDNEVVLNTQSEAVYAIFNLLSPISVVLAKYHLKIKPELGGTHLISFSNSVNVTYAYFDKTDLIAYGTSTGGTEVITFTNDFDKYLFWEDADAISFTGSSPIRSIGGSLPPSLLSLDISALNLKEVYNNMFKTATSILSVDLRNNTLSTHEINKIIKYIYESLANFAIASNVDMDLQTPTAPPTSDDAISYFISTILTNITLITD